MKVYNQSKTEILTEYDLETGYLKFDIITHIIPAIEKVQEVYHIKPIQGMEGCFKRVIDIQGVKAVPEHEETEEIQVYIPYTLEEIEKRNAIKRIAELKKLLADSDYKAIKYAEGEILEEEYLPIKEQRRAWRAEINELEIYE